MGVIVTPSFTTEHGFVIAELYLSINYCRLITNTDQQMQCIFTIQAYTSRDDKRANKAPLNLPSNLSTVEIVLPHDDFYRMSIYGIAYQAIKSRWSSLGYQLQDIYEPSQPTSSQYIYDSSGYAVDGYNSIGFNRAGYNRDGYNATGYRADGFNIFGYNAPGYNMSGFNAQGYNAEGYDITGFNAQGWNTEGFGRDGYNAQGLDVHGNPRT